MRLIGRVKWYNSARGFGLIQPERGEAVFVESSAVQGPALEGLERGQNVEFEIALGPRGPHAERVVPVSRLLE